jgi:hypothetical protein
MGITVGDYFQGIHDQKKLLRWVLFKTVFVLGYFVVLVKSTPQNRAEHTWSGIKCCENLNVLWVT